MWLYAGMNTDAPMRFASFMFEEDSYNDICFATDNIRSVEIKIFRRKDNLSGRSDITKCSKLFLFLFSPATIPRL